MSTGRRFLIPDSGFAQDRELDHGDLPAILAEGRLDPGGATYEDVEHDYLETAPLETGRVHHPPYEWDYTPEQLSNVMQWTETRIQYLDALHDDNTRKFLETYAAYRNREVSRLQLTPGGGNAAYRRERSEMERPVTAAPGAQVPQASPLRTEEAGMAPREVLSELSDLRYGERMRSARISGWIERPEIMGRQGLSAEVYGHVESAYVDVKARLEQFANVPNHNVFVDTSVTEVRNLFARIAATMATITDFFLSPTTTLDRNKQRLTTMLSGYYQQLNHWEYDTQTHTFTHRKTPDINYEHENELALPSVRRSHIYGRYRL